jgi:hypothetical protein
LAARRHCDEFACARRGNAPVALADGKSVGDFQIPWGAASAADASVTEPLIGDLRQSSP